MTDEKNEYLTTDGFIEELTICPLKVSLAFLILYTTLQNIQYKLSPDSNSTYDPKEDVSQINATADLIEEQLNKLSKNEFPHIRYRLTLILQMKDNILRAHHFYTVNYRSH